MYRPYAHIDPDLISWTHYAGRSCLRFRVTPDQSMKSANPTRKITALYLGEQQVTADAAASLTFSICVPATWRFEDGFGDPDYAVKILTLHGTGERGEVGMYINRDRFEFALHSDPGQTVPNRDRAIVPDEWCDFDVRLMLGRSKSSFVEVVVNGVRWFKHKGFNVPAGEDKQWLNLGMDTRGAKLGVPNFPEGCLARDLYVQPHEFRWGR